MTSIALHIVGERFIGPIEDALLSNRELEIRRVWSRLPAASAQYFATLDKLTIEDEFFQQLGWRVPQEKLFNKGLRRVGDLIALTEAELQDKSNLGPRELKGVLKALSALGLAMGSNVDLWREYRATVPEDFRLKLPYGMRLPCDVGSPMLT